MQSRPHAGSHGGANAYYTPKTAAAQGNARTERGQGQEKRAVQGGPFDMPV